MTSWSKSVGTRPHRVRVFERKDRSGIYLEHHDRKESLRHSDRKRAQREAAEKYAELMQGHRDSESITLGGLFALYLRWESPKKSRPEADGRAAAMWERFLRRSKNPLRISSNEWDSFIVMRRSGEIDAQGKIVPEEARRPVRNRTIEADCKWLSAVLNWGSKQSRPGGYLLAENCVRGYPIPKEKNPRRETANRERYEATLAVADEVTMAVRRNGKAETQRSYLREMLMLAAETGRRIGAIRQLRREDLRLDRTETYPHGAILWPADTDKIGFESLVPISTAARAALDAWLAERPIVGRAYLFPSPLDPEKPVSKDMAADWLTKSEKLAGLEPLDGTLWHAYRRMFAIEMKHLPVQDVAFLGGWKSIETLQRVYQQHDPDTLLFALNDRKELRDVR